MWVVQNDFHSCGLQLQFNYPVHLTDVTCLHLIQIISYSIICVIDIHRLND